MLNHTAGFGLPDGALRHLGGLYPNPRLLVPAYKILNWLQVGPE